MNAQWGLMHVSITAKTVMGATLVAATLAIPSLTMDSAAQVRTPPYTLHLSSDISD